MEFFSSSLIINFFKVRNWQVNDCKKVFCNSDSIASSFATYFNTVHVNTYNNSFPSIVLSNGTIPALGSSNINYSDNTMTIITNVGDEGGGNVYINATIVRKK